MKAASTHARHGLAVLADAPALRSFLDAEGDSGMRLLTAPDGSLRPRSVAALKDVIDREVASGAYRPPADTQVLADGIAALFERYLYHGRDPELNPDLETARRVIGLLLREPCPDSATATR